MKVNPLIIMPEQIKWFLASPSQSPSPRGLECAAEARTPEAGGAAEMYGNPSVTAVLHEKKRGRASEEHSGGKHDAHGAFILF